MTRWYNWRSPPKRVHCLFPLSLKLEPTTNSLNLLCLFPRVPLSKHSRWYSPNRMMSAEPLNCYDLHTTFEFLFSSVLCCPKPITFSAILFSALIKSITMTTRKRKPLQTLDERSLLHQLPEPLLTAKGKPAGTNQKCTLKEGDEKFLIQRPNKRTNRVLHIS